MCRHTPALLIGAGRFCPDESGLLDLRPRLTNAHITPLTSYRTLSLVPVNSGLPRLCGSILAISHCACCLLDGHCLARVFRHAAAPFDF